MENQRLDPDVERVAAQDYEVEVPPCERGAKDFPSPYRRGARGEVQKSDRSADASGASHRLPSPFQSKRKDVHSIKKRCCTFSPKAGWQHPRQGLRSDQGRAG